ncbi:hypothetical protein GGS23DRAFT_364711 [Durotheca rogersii]|uniref:uncharacterized protein n=1 Tax=Durotheca rogersii TaxID=419775 RepID=UPI00221F66CA|nr:uncharacterized protein GGS23DRAFT_364711 [Durotheca rogersii]KAI5866020.1 hypothetical protein GGS23DRAFT_364711 [Durotheca rogersii]
MVFFVIIFCGWFLMGIMRYTAQQKQITDLSDAALPCAPVEFTSWEVDRRTHDPYAQLSTWGLQFAHFQLFGNKQAGNAFFTITKGLDLDDMIASVVQVQARLNDLDIDTFNWIFFDSHQFPADFQAAVTRASAMPCFFKVIPEDPRVYTQSNTSYKLTDASSVNTASSPKRKEHSQGFSKIVLEKHLAGYHQLWQVQPAPGSPRTFSHGWSPSTSDRITTFFDSIQPTHSPQEGVENSLHRHRTLRKQRHGQSLWSETGTWLFRNIQAKPECPINALQIRGYPEARIWYLNDVGYAYSTYEQSTSRRQLMLEAPESTRELGVADQQADIATLDTLEIQTLVFGPCDTFSHQHHQWDMIAKDLERQGAVPGLRSGRTTVGSDKTNSTQSRAKCYSPWHLLDSTATQSISLGFMVTAAFLVAHWITNSEKSASRAFTYHTTIRFTACSAIIWVLGKLLSWLQVGNDKLYLPIQLDMGAE